MTLQPPDTLLRKFFTGLAEYVFQARLGMVDPPLIDYVSNLICRFVRLDGMYQVHTIDGQPLREVVDMVAVAESRDGLARRDVHQHIGDFTLFWVGLYPESLRRMRRSSRKDCLIDYYEQGKRAYLEASRIVPDEDFDPPGEVLERLSDRFEVCAYGLQQVRREWENDAQGGEAHGPRMLG